VRRFHPFNFVDIMAAQVNKVNGDHNKDGAGEELWRHSSPKTTPMWKFLEFVNAKHKLELRSYDDLYHWSTEHIASFWEQVWNFAGVRASQPFEQVRNTLNLLCDAVLRMCRLWMKRRLCILVPNSSREQN